MQIYSGTLDLILIIRDLRMMAMCCGEVRGSNLRCCVPIVRNLTRASARLGEEDLRTCSGIGDVSTGLVMEFQVLCGY
jgi:hypothetical protein